MNTTVAAPAATDPYINGIRYTAAGMMCVQSGFAAPLNSPKIGGVARDNLGVVYVLLESTPPQAFYNGGFLCDYFGTVYGTVSNPIAGYSQGMPVDSLGRLCIA
jgi:hypothetical protein